LTGTTGLFRRALIVRAESTPAGNFDLASCGSSRWFR
jgi:hypothetical protein